jgi:hypothetical protein
MTAPTDPQAYAEWRQTGVVVPPKAAPAPAKDTSASGEPGEKGAPASEAGKPTQETRRRGDAETRLTALLQDLKTAGLTPAELKTFKRAAAPAGDKDVKPASSAAPGATRHLPLTYRGAAAVELNAPVKPDFAKVKPDGTPWTWEEMEAAKEKYHEENAEYRSAKAVMDFEIRTAQAAQETGLRGKIAEAVTRYGEGAHQTIVDTAASLGFGARGAAAGEIPGVVQALIDQSPVIVDLLYVMGEKPEDLAAFLALAKSNPGAAVRKLVFTEQLVIDELRKGKGAAPPDAGTEPAAGRDPSGRFTAPAPVKPKASAAPAPADEVSGRAPTPQDELAAAANKGEFTREWMAKANARDIARKQGK